ncbi:MAG: hypothetical protein AB7I96_02480 [Candidatus Dadabacteria bacterium]
MFKGCGRILPKGVIAILAIALFAIGGCDVEFGGGGDNGGGGGGGGGSEIETIQGSVVDVIPDEPLEGIIVDVSVDGIDLETGVTDDGGFFSIEGPIAGTALLEFTSESGMLLGSYGVEIFPTAIVELGDITLENGVVKLDNTNPEVTFDAEVTQNNCTGNSGSMQVEARNDQGTRVAVVQISNSTDIIIDGDEVDCEDIIVGRNVEIQGDLISSSTVDASRVEIN